MDKRKKDMIDSRELRIGNLVLRDGRIVLCFNPYDCFEPIPLTEERLLKFGFEKKEWYGMLVSGGKDISGCDYYKDSTSIRVSLSDDVCQKGVHWFQNWYYFETGEELMLHN